MTYAPSNANVKLILDQLERGGSNLANLADGMSFCVKVIFRDDSSSSVKGSIRDILEAYVIYAQLLKPCYVPSELVLDAMSWKET